MHLSLSSICLKEAENYEKSSSATLNMMAGFGFSQGYLSLIFFSSILIGMLHLKMQKSCKNLLSLLPCKPNHCLPLRIALIRRIMMFRRQEDPK